ncbi:MAG TPA: hypothetical protein VKP67_19355 [Xanthobacteraceae bacterium]|nr:hypothetical protein [Xanthobacteraceae bacterium]
MIINLAAAPTHRHFPRRQRRAQGRRQGGGATALISIGLSLGFLLLAGCAAQPAGTASQAPVAALQPNMARVWVLRQPSAPGGNVAGADPMVYANGAPLAQSAQGTVYYRDFQPGTYRFTVQPYGTPANLVDTLQLAPGTQAYVQVQAVPNWEMGSTAGGVSFAVLTMSPQEAQAYMPTMKDLGQR